MFRVLALLLFTIIPFAALAQEAPPRPAVLIADDIFITSDRELVASGNVEAYQGSIRLEAREIRYNRTTGALTITGPIRLQEGDSVVILATAADLEPSLRRGLLIGARMVIEQQLQLAAATVQRVDEQYDQLYKTAVTSCNVCEDGRPPLWQIRARRVIHDKQTRQLYFDQAQLRIRNVPVLYIPRLRLPDPTVSRATGFLVPSWRSSSRLGFGIKVPYFIALREDRDITITPYVSPKTKTVEFRYRQAYRNGRIRFSGAISRDDEMPGDTRGYIFGEGEFDLPADFKLAFGLEATKDDAYLKDYDYSNKDRLETDISISRARRDEYIYGGLINYYSLRDGERNSTLPTIVGDVVYDRRFFPVAIGGELRVSAMAHGHRRYSDRDIDGRDVARLNAKAEWLRGWTLGKGLRADATLGIAGDIFNIRQDSTVDQHQSQLVPYSSVSFRYPMTKTEGGGATQYLEPLAQVGWTGDSDRDIPNDESTRVEFDAGNLLSLSRFPAADRRERGAVGALGVNWARFDPNGNETWITLGQVFRNKADSDFTKSSGLSGTRSDYLVAGQIKTASGLEITARSLFDHRFAFSKAEVRGGFENARSSLSGSYVWLVSDPDQDRPRNFSEIALDGSLRLASNWTANADWRYDLSNDRAATAGVGMIYTNECVTVDLSVKRRYTSSSNVEPSTSFGFSIGLRGFSARKGTDTYARTCG